ncbi:hypothetical protein [Peribacillus asahii]|uniref:hypothetical protein n=1 Tax=Peribacillus asahii TaxID=228899 RepID=UPI0038172E6D
MKYNKKQQPFSILGRFRIVEQGKGEVEYCRIKFHNTGHVAVIPNGQVKELDFEDDSINVDNTWISGASIQTGTITASEIEGSSQVDIIGEELVNELLEEPSIVAIAINRDGEEFRIHDLEAFVAEYDLDIEAVQAVLEGKQKTHRKWRFTAV